MNKNYKNLIEQKIKNDEYEIIDNEIIINKGNSEEIKISLGKDCISIDLPMSDVGFDINISGCYAGDELNKNIKNIIKNILK